MTEKELFISWLNDAYSTELAMMPVLENHAADARDHPEIYQREMRHLAETRRQAERLETMIKSLGGKISTVKSITGKTLGLGKSISTEFFSDEMIKNFISDFAAENLEIASYRSLIATAKHIGENQCVPVLEEILAEEIAMARWLEEHIPMATAESIKIVTGEARGKRSKKTNRARSAVAGLLTPSALVTLLGVGAIGTGAAMLLQRSSKNKNGGNGSKRRLESRNGVDDRISNSSNDLEQSDVVVRETLIIAVEPEISVSQDSDREKL